MDKIKQSMIRAAQELRALAGSTTDPTLKRRLLDQADNLELASQEESQDETKFSPGPGSAMTRLWTPY